MAVHLFSTEQNHYAYDVSSNEIVRVSPMMRALLQVLSEDTDLRPRHLCRLETEWPPQALVAGLEAIEELRNVKAIFLPKPKELEVLTGRADLVHGEGDLEFTTLVLVLTEDCNFRCSYCTFSGAYDNEGLHRQISMAESTALAALDFFFQRTSVATPAVTFYGGEPLLEKDLLKKVVRHARAKNPRTLTQFTTNGYLLDESFVRFLIESDTAVIISLDGPEEIHNSCRVLRSGAGTFRRIVQNIEMIAEIDNDFLKRRVLIRPTVTAGKELETIIGFFREHPILRECTIVPGLMRQAGLRHSRGDTKTFERVHRADFNVAYDRYLRGLATGDLSGLSFEHGLFGTSLRHVLLREIEPIPAGITVSGPCVPGRLRLVVSADGSFTICDRTRAMPKIGEIRKGIDFEAIERMYEDLSKVIRNCKQCWAIRLCNVCWAHIYSSGLDSSEVAKVCDSTRRSFDLGLRLFADVLEGNPEAFGEPLLSTFFLPKSPLVPDSEQ